MLDIIRNQENSHLQSAILYVLIAALLLQQLSGLNTQHIKQLLKQIYLQSNPPEACINVLNYATEGGGIN